MICLDGISRKVLQEMSNACKIVRLADCYWEEKRGGDNMDKREKLREGGEGADSAEKRIDRARRAGEKRKRTRSYGNASPYPLPIE